MPGSTCSLWQSHDHPAQAIIKVTRRQGLSASVNALGRPSLERLSSESISSRPGRHSRDQSTEVFPGFAGGLYRPWCCARPAS